LSEPEKEGKTEKKRLPVLNIGIKILLFFALITVNVIALRPLQLTLQERMQTLRDEFIRQTGNALGRKIQYGSIGPSIFGVLDIRNVVILRDDDSVFLNVARLRLSYSFFHLLRGDTMDAFRSASIDRPVLNFDFEKDADLADRLASMQAEGDPAPEYSGSFFELLPDRFTFRIRNGEWGLDGSTGAIKISGVQFDVSLRQSRISFNGRWNALVSVYRGNGLADFFPVSSGDFSVGVNGRLRGDYSDERKAGNATVSIPFLTGETFRFRPFSFGFRLSEDQLEINNIDHQSPVVFSLAYNFVNRKLKCSLGVDDFSPNSVISLTGPWAAYNQALNIIISGSAFLETDDSEGLRYGVELSGLGPRNSTGNLFLDQSSLNIAAAGNEDRVRIDAIELRSPFGDFKFRGAVSLGHDGILQFAPSGMMSFSDFRLHGTHGISGDFFVETSGNEVTVFGENFTVSSVKLPSIDLSLLWESRGISFSLFALNHDGTGNKGKKSGVGSMTLTGSLDYAPRQIHANLHLDSFAVGDALGFVEPMVSMKISPIIRTMLDDVLVTTEVFFTTDYNHIIYNAPLVVAAYEGLLDIFAAASLSGTDRGVELSSARVSWDKGSAEINGSLDFSNTQNIFFSLGTHFRDLTYFFEGTIRDKRDINIRGSYGFQFYLTSGSSGASSGHVRGDGIPFPTGERFASLSFLSNFSYDSKSKWQAAAERFEITGLTTPASSFASLRFTGMANENGLTIPNILFDDGRGTLGGEIHLDWDPDFSFCSFKTNLSGSNYNENYSLEGVYKNNRLDLYLAGRRMQFSRFSSRNAVADATLKLSWESLSSFTAESEITSFALYHQNEVLRASAHINIDEDEFLARNLNVNYSGLEASVPSLRISRGEALLETGASIWGLFSQRPVEILFRGNATFNQSSTWLDLISDFDNLNGIVSVSRARYDTITAEEPFGFVVNMWQENRALAMNLIGGPKNMLRFRYVPEIAGGGNLEGSLSSPSPVQGNFAGFFDSDIIDITGTNLFVNLGSLWRFIPPSDAIEFTGGTVTATVRVAGSPEEPEFYGNALGTGLQILIPQFISEPIRPVPVYVSIDGYEMSFGPVDAFVGSRGRGNVRGLFRFDQWIPNIFNIDVRVPDDSPLPYDIDMAGLLANGYASGRIALAMEDLVLSITGDLIAHDTGISLNYTEITSMDGEQALASENKTVSVITDIAIRTGRRVEFFLPSFDFPVLQANADLGTGIRITSDDVARRFSLTGDVRLRSGEIFYLERNFYIREGTLFFAENETQFDPRITARAEIRDQSNIGPVVISMIIDNAPIRSFTPRFVSTPTLSQIDIYSILGQSIQQGESDLRNIATSAALDGLAQFAVMQRLQRQVRDFFGLDMLSMRTQLLQNMVFQVAGAPSRGSIFDRAYRVGNYFDNTTIFMGKFFGPDLFGEAMFSFKYDENKVAWGGLVIEPELGFEIRNPLFDIRINMLPLHPENMFINDVTFSLTWRRSF